jgi:hypothetical protein
VKFDIKHRFSGEVVFCAEIQCSDDASYSLKIGLAAKAAIASKADLSGANLSWADLSGADLSKANLRYIKHDVWGILLNAIPEVPALRQAILDGRVNGSTYEGECACLCGTIANARGVNYEALDGISPDSSSMAERFFMGIRKGDTPATNAASKMVLEWVEEFMNLVGLPIVAELGGAGR